MKKLTHLLHLTSKKNWSTILASGEINARTAPNPYNLTLPREVSQMIKFDEYLVGLDESCITAWKDSELFDWMQKKARKTMALKIPLMPVKEKHVLIRDAFFISPYYIAQEHGKKPA